MTQRCDRCNNEGWIWERHAIYPDLSTLDLDLSQPVPEEVEITTEMVKVECPQCMGLGPAFRYLR